MKHTTKLYFDKCTKYLVMVKTIITFATLNFLNTT